LGTNSSWTSNVTFGTSADLTFNASNANASSTATPAFTGAPRIIRSLNFGADADNDVFIRLTTNATGTSAANLTFQAANDGFNVAGDLTYGASLEWVIASPFLQGDYTSFSLSDAFAGSLLTTGMVWELMSSRNTRRHDELSGDLTVSVVPQHSTRLHLPRRPWHWLNKSSSSPANF
jgi:hypothetical protein